MKNEGGIHHCGECIHFREDPQIHRVTLAEDFIDTLSQDRGKIVSPKERRNKLYEILSKNWVGGIKTCIENTEIEDASFRKCENEDKFCPRRNLINWISRLTKRLAL